MQQSKHWLLQPLKQKPSVNKTSHPAVRISFLMFQIQLDSELINSLFFNCHLSFLHDTNLCHATEPSAMPRFFLSKRHLKNSHHWSDRCVNRERALLRSLTHYCQIPAEAWGNWDDAQYRSCDYLTKKQLKKSARLPRWDQKTELDSCHVWEHPTCLGQPHADRLFLEPVVAIEAQLLEDITHLVRVTKRRGMEGGYTDSDSTRRYRRRIEETERDGELGRRTKKRQTDRWAEYPQRQRGQTHAETARGWHLRIREADRPWHEPALQRCMQPLGRDVEPTWLTHVQSMRGVRPGGGFMPGQRWNWIRQYVIVWCYTAK